VEADGGLAERLGVMMAAHQGGMQRLKADAVTLQRLPRSDTGEGRGGGEIIIGGQAFEARGVPVDPDPGDPVAPPHRQAGVGPAHHHHDIAALGCAGILHRSEHHDVAAGIVGADLDDILADAADHVFRTCGRG